MTRIVSIFIATLAATVVLPQSALAGAAVPVSISINRHPEPKRRINWSAVHAASKQIDVAKGQLSLGGQRRPQHRGSDERV